MRQIHPARNSEPVQTSCRHEARLCWTAGIVAPCENEYRGPQTRVLKFPSAPLKRPDQQEERPNSFNEQPPEDLSASMDAFIEMLRVKNYSEATVKGRISYLGIFARWCRGRGLNRACDVRRAILEEYQRHLYHLRRKDGQPVSVSSQHAHLLPLRALFKWLARENRIPHDPATDMELPRAEHRLPRHVLSAREAELVLTQPATATGQGIRDRAILETFYSTGIRRMELANLAVADIDFERGTILIRRGKGRKDRTVPIGERALMWIRRYMAEVRPNLVGDPDDGTLFLTCTRKRLTLDRLSQMVLAYVRSAKIGKAGSCHLFRHSMATLMLENGADIRFIQEMLGHAKLETTQIYTRVSIQKLKQVHRTCHPARTV